MMGTSSVGTLVDFLSWPDFLLGLSAQQNGSLLSNVCESADDYGLLNRGYRSWNGSLFVGDSYTHSTGQRGRINPLLRAEKLGPGAVA